MDTEEIIEQLEKSKQELSEWVVSHHKCMMEYVSRRLDDTPSADTQGRIIVGYEKRIAALRYAIVDQKIKQAGEKLSNVPRIKTEPPVRVESKKYLWLNDPVLTKKVKQQPNPFYVEEREW